MTLVGNFGDPKTERDIRSAKRFNFFALAVLMMLVAASLWFYLQLNEKQRQLEHKTRELADSTSKLSKIRGELEAAQLLLATNEKRREEQLQNLSKTVEGRKFDVAVKLATDYSEDIAAQKATERVFVNVYAWRADDGVLADIKHFFSTRDYMLMNTEAIPTFAKWLGEHSAVYYYTPKMKGQATLLASQLGTATGLRFDVLQGRPEDVPSINHDWMNVHYLGGRPMVE